MFDERANISQSQTGSHRQQGSSLSSLLSTLIPIIIVASIAFLVFLVFQKRFDRVYGPRTYLSVLDDDERSPKQSAGFLGWMKEYTQIADEYVLAHSSLDNYLFLRLFKILMIVCFVGCLITWPVLFPGMSHDMNDTTGLQADMQQSTPLAEEVRVDLTSSHSVTWRTQSATMHMLS